MQRPLDMIPHLTCILAARHKLYNRTVKPYFKPLDRYCRHAEGAVAAHCLLVIGQHIIRGSTIVQCSIYERWIELRLLERGSYPLRVSYTFLASMLCRAQRQVEPFHGFIAPLPACQRQCTQAGPTIAILVIRLYILLAVDDFQAKKAPGDINRAYITYLAYP